MPIRNLELEKKAVDTFIQTNKAKPQTPDDWAKIYRMSYGNQLPDELKSTTAASVYYSSLPQNVQESQLGGLKQGVEQAKVGVQQTSQPNEFLRVLQGAIKEKTNAKQQQLGASDIYKAAGLTGFATLNQSLAARKSELEVSMADMKDIVAQMAGTYKDLASTAMFNYESSVNAYNQEVDRLQKIQDDIRDNEQAIQMAKLNEDIETGLAKYKSDLSIKEAKEKAKIATQYPSIAEQLELQKIGGMITSESKVTVPQANRPQRNNNPGNIKVPNAGLEEAMKRYNDSGITIDPNPAMDGGYFLKFSTPEKGLMAMGTLLSMYGDITIDQALRKWSGDGYGGEIVQNIANKTFSKLTPIEKMSLILKMANREGYFDNMVKNNSDMLDDAFKNVNSQLPAERQKYAQKIFDEYIQNGKEDQAKQYIKTLAFDSMSTTQQEQVSNKQRLINDLPEISNELKMLEKEYGIKTGWLTGTEDDILKKIGRTKNDKARYLQNKILNDVIAYRRAATGVQFNVIEQQQYERLFPNINQIGEVNQANIAALQDVMSSEIANQYSMRMGAENFNQLFKGEYPKSGYMNGNQQIEDIKKKYNINY